MIAPYQPPETTPLYEQYLKEQRERARQAQAASTAPAKPDTAHPNETRGSVAEGMLTAPLHGLFPLEDEVGGAIGGGMNALLNLARGGKANLREEVNRAIEARRANLRAAHGVAGGVPATALETAGAVAPMFMGVPSAAPGASLAERATTAIPQASGTMGRAQSLLKVLGVNVGEAAPAASRAGRVAQAGARAAGFGAMQAAGNAEGGVGERLRAGAEAMPAAAGLGMLIPGAMEAKDFAAQHTPIPRSGDERALWLLGRQIHREDMDPSHLAREAPEMLPDERLADRLGPSGQRAARYVAATPGEGSARMTKQLVARGLARPARLTEAAETALGTSRGNAPAMQRALEEAQRAEAATNYGIARATPPVDDPEILASIARSPVLREAHEIARHAIYEATGHMPPPLVRPVTLPTGEEAMELVPQGINVLDLMKRSVNHTVGRQLAGGNTVTHMTASAAAGHLGDVLDQLDAIRPEYATARQQFARAQRMQTGLEQGQSALMPSTHPGTVAEQFASVGEEGRPYYRQGALTDLWKRTEGNDLSGDKSLTFMQVPETRQKLGTLAQSPEHADRLTHTVDRERAMQQLERRSLQGSPTAPILQDVKDMEGNLPGASEVIGAVASGPYGVAKLTLMEAIRRRAQGINEQTASALADMLMARGEDIPTLMARLQAPRTRTPQAMTPSRARAQELLSYLGGFAGAGSR